MVLLDTHIWLWWLIGDGPLKPAQRNKLDQLAARGEIAISWVTVWETEMLERKDRIYLEPDFTTWIKAATRPEVCKVLMPDIQTVAAQRKLPEFFHGDPADRLITATALKTGYSLATIDRKIIESEAVEIADL